MLLVTLLVSLPIYALSSSAAFAQKQADEDTLTFPHSSTFTTQLEPAGLSSDTYATSETENKEEESTPDTTREEENFANTPAQVKDPTAHLYVIGAGFGLMLGGSVTWKFYNKWTGDFNVVDEGWFGDDTYAGGADKLGHAYTDFVFVRGIYWIYQAHSYNHAESILYSWLYGSSLRTIMEIADGYTTYRTSYGDLAFNMLGSTLSALLLINPKVEKTFHLSWSYLPSRELREGYHEVQDFSTDYSGMIFSLDTNIKGLRDLLGFEGNSIADYLQVGINYFTRGFRSPEEFQKKERFVGMNIGLNMAEIGPDYAFTRALLKYYKLPGTFMGANYNIDEDQWEFQAGLNYFF